MVWKPKEKELTPEEAIALARKELEPFWFRSEPLICGVKGEGGVQAIPLDSGFTKKSWLLFFIDPSELAGEAVMQYAKEWFRRYNVHNLGFLVVFRPPYKFYNERPIVNQYIDRLGLSFPMAVDSDGLLSQAFHAEPLPKVMLLRQNEIVFAASGKDWKESTELKIQGVLRQTDPGLPLSPPFSPTRTLSIDRLRLEMGSSASGDRVAKFPAGFVDTPQGFRAGKFVGLRLDRMEPNEIYLSGQWVQDGEKLATQDPQATMGLSVPAGRLSIIAENMNEKDRLDAAKISVEILDKPAYEGIAGEHLTLDESGLALVKVREANLYHVLHKLPAREREVTLRFPFADREAVAIYGIRYGD